MLQIKNITKTYKIGDIEQKALNDVSLNFRNNEFVAILGTSGAGKTTLLNIIGGLDRYDEGDLIINGTSTKKYKDRDWDSYRNHTIGFVFQSYNLIPHQSILSNVELALTISGISKTERTNRAKQALIDVGLEQHINKKPNQLSGGQMQRVAIARALVNNPSILLADEPTGALDSETSIQVMDMLKEVAKDRLVIMVTHNPELAEQYANRIVQIKDGEVLSDTNPFDTEEPEELNTKNMGKSSMSVFTSLALSFNNLKTKKSRTILTAFAGSIGIIGIAMILSISNGVNQYIKDIQKETMTSYPIYIENTTFDLNGMLNSIGMTEDEDDITTEVHEDGSVYANHNSLNATSSVLTSVVENNLKSFKTYIEDPNNEVTQYIGENGVVYSYNTKFGIFSYDEDGVLINSDGSSLQKSKLEEMHEQSMAAMMSMGGADSELVTNIADEILSNDSQVSDAIKNTYDVVVGRYPEAYNEMILVLNKNNEIDSSVLYNLGIFPSKEHDDIIDRINNEEKLDLEAIKVDANKILNQELYIIPQCDYYSLNENTGLYTKTDSITDEMLDNAIKVKIVGIIKLKDSEKRGIVNTNVGYTQALTKYLMDYTNNSSVVKAQIADEKTNIINGYSFEAKSDADKIKDVKEYFSNMTTTEKLMFMGGDENTDAEQIAQMVAMFDGYIEQMTDNDLLEIYNTSISAGSYEKNMQNFGVVYEDSPSAISIYVDSFDNKEIIGDIIKDYNDKVSDTEKITYTDYIGLILSSVTTIIDVISYVLIAFVSVSLIVSSIMIGIITYISVLERTKEIGILRAMGASKRNISQVFNAETFIIGLLSGLLGVGLTLLATIPANNVVHSLTNNNNINAHLPLENAIALIILSIILTLLGGLLPAKKASKQNPVNALRSE